MRDVALEAGVSPMTVSNALTGRRPVSEETRRRVLETVDRLGYQVNVAARNLRQGRAGVVGIAVPVLDAPYYGFLAHRLTKAFRAAGWSTVVEETGASREGEIAAFNGSRLNAYDGLVLTAVGLREADLKVLSGELPVVVLGEQELHRAVDHVGMANVEASAAATELLLAKGCRRIAALGSPPLDRLDGPLPEDLATTFVLRGQGFREAVRGRRGVRATAVFEGTMLPDGAKAADALLEEFPDVDGIFCLTDSLAYGALRRLLDRGVKVPDDVLVIGFDDLEDSAYRIPSLSSVNPGHEFMVTETVRLLVRRMADRDAVAEDVVAPFHLVERESTTR